MSPPASLLRFGLLRTATIRSVARSSEVQHQHCLDTSCPPNAPSSSVHGLHLSLYQPSWQGTHPGTASGFFPDTSMVRLDPLRPGGRPCRSSSTVAASSGCRRVAAAAPLSMVPPVMEVSSEDDTLVERQVGDEDGALGLPMDFGFGLKLRHPAQVDAEDGALGLPIDVIGPGLKLEPRPIYTDEGLMPIFLIKVAHAHFKLAHQVAQFLNNPFKKKTKQNL
ncbi:hypothetical protein CK203_044867 [Vitis vinifera]|uniref:Uncharacterized protein n=1 Tax=Vitis vinifera TaxID=29760 RepID=A0A438H1A4_VITVI|nr:hypothetical protein CK203_044867 [Vitis vinifera]